ncbi:MAG TPA: metal-sulfur cluster assembly factor [Solirubrobacteraceae bacterium]|nr:metal-sulfur cluster assembly factor [Solirubrobacteraceae bacterium]
MSDQQGQQPTEQEQQAQGAAAPAGGAGAPTQQPGAGGVPVNVEEVMDALANVIDPELGLDFVELGLIYGVEIDGGDVRVTYTLTTPGCPIGPHVAAQIEELVGEVEGVASVQSELTFTPAWTPERMSEDAKFALGFG